MSDKYDSFDDADMPEDDGREVDQFYASEQRRPPRIFKTEKVNTRYTVRDTAIDEAAAKTEEEIEDERKQRAEAAAERKARLSKAPSPAKVTLERIPRSEFKMLVTRAMLGDGKARDDLITLTHLLGHSTLAATYDEEIRCRAIMAVTDKLFTRGMIGLGIGLYFDLSRGFDPSLAKRGHPLTSFLVKSLKNAAIDELRKKTALRDAQDISVPYSAPSYDDDSEYSAALTAQKLGHSADGKPIVPGADALDPLRQLTERRRFEAVMSAKLTPREQEVFDLWAELGDENRVDATIAAKLGISAERVRALMAQVRAKILMAQVRAKIKAASDA